MSRLFSIRRLAIGPAARAVCAMFLAALLPVSLSAVESEVEPQTGTAPRIVAIGDIHGALEPFELILRRAGLIDEQRSWIGGTDILVQTGDIFDRGSDVRQVAELLQSLQEQARQAGGQVIVLLGNHEALNLTMELRDVTPEIVEQFAGKRSLKRRDRYCERLRRRAEQQRKPDQASVPRATFLATCRGDVPVGMLEYLQALAPDEPLGRWLRGLPTVVQVEGWVFLHGGLSPSWGTESVQAINQRTRQELEQFDRLRSGLLDRDLIVETSGLTEITGVARALAVVIKERDVVIRNPSLEDLMSTSSFGSWSLFDPQGPLWFRGYATWSDAEGEALLPAILDAQAARGIVVGHTPQKSRAVGSRFDQRVLLIDTGMLGSVYGGRPSALEIHGDSLSVIYPEGREPLDPAVDP